MERYTVHQKNNSVGRLSVCRQCKKSQPHMNRCANCCVALYCSKECQKANWKDHKQFCKDMQEARKKTGIPFNHKSVKNTTKIIYEHAKDLAEVAIDCYKKSGKKGVAILAHTALTEDQLIMLIEGKTPQLINRIEYITLDDLNSMENVPEFTKKEISRIINAYDPTCGQFAGGVWEKPNGAFHCCLLGFSPRPQLDSMIANMDYNQIYKDGDTSK